MFPIQDHQEILDQIYYDHSYAFTEIHHKYSIRNYYLKPSFQNFRTNLTDTNASVNIGTINNDNNMRCEIRTQFRKRCEVVLKLLFGDNYEPKGDQDVKLEYPDAETLDKPKFLMWYRCDDWTISDVNFRSRLVKILEDGYGVLVMGSWNGSEAHFNGSVQRLSKRINNAYSSAHWRMDICSFVHAHLLEHLADELLVVYIECLKQLFNRLKTKTIFEQLNNWAQSHKVLQRFSWSTLLGICHKEVKEEKMDRSILWPIHPKSRPIVIHIYSERWAESTRMIAFSLKLRKFCNVSEFRFDDSGRLRKKFETLRSLLQAELKSKKSPIFVMGWDLGALLGLLSSIKIHGVNAASFTGVICLGLPLKGLKGERGIIPEDYIHLLSKETLIISGDMSAIGNGDDIEDFKDRMKGRVSIRHVNIGGCDHILRLSSGYALRCQLSQAMVDLTILKEIRSFMVDQVSSSHTRSEEAVESRGTDDRYEVLSARTPLSTQGPDHFGSRR